jgi:hypothetical protein
VAKALLFVVAALVVFVAGYIAYARLIGNPKVVEEIRTNPAGERAGIVTLLTFADGRQIPVNYLREGDKVYLGADGPWWRALRDGGAPVSLLIRGDTLKGHAVVILDDPDYTHDVFARLRPRAPAWLPDWLNGKLVVVTLTAR